MNRQKILVYPTGRLSGISKLPEQRKTLDIGMTKFTCQVGNEGTMAVDRTL